MVHTLKRSLNAAALGVALAGACSFASLPASASAPPSDPGPTVATVPERGTITVAGTGRVTVEPDTAVLNVGVQANAETGAEAMSQVTDDSNALAEALVAAGIAEEDIQTSGLSLWSRTGDDGITVTGYEASLNVDVTIRDIEAVGPTIDAAQEAVGEGFTIGGVSFSFSDPESVLQQARADAVFNAQTIAAQYADAAGVTLGSIVSIVDNPNSGISPIQFGRAEAAAMDMSVAVNPGTLDLTVTISATFATS